MRRVRELTLLLGTASVSSSEDLFFKFSTATMTWTQLDAGAGVMGTAPSARYGHGMAAVGENLYVFGGRDDSGESEGSGGVEARIGHARLPFCVRHQSARGEVVGQGARPCVIHGVECVRSGVLRLQRQVDPLCSSVSEEGKGVVGAESPGGGLANLVVG